ncbi:Histidinol phosphate phosphatase, HisJ [Candidatus Magnetomorum sp. HK-1]|nr:Histidinol phosphate phosphatase, HisJ [Candidatus Magnetomorum sp. HK-1]
MTINMISKVSIHGGHSGEFCHHAKDSLEKIVQTYIQKGFEWVGITEHIPPPNNALRYQDEKDDKLDQSFLAQRFMKYFQKAKQLKIAYKDDITLYIGFETEAYSGFVPHVKSLVQKYQPDFVVGSVHHVNDINFDFSESFYAQAVDKAGGIIPLYAQYFDIQFEMIQALQPKVIGHFDVIRIHDPLYIKHLNDPIIEKRIDRNLSMIRSQQMILDFNLRSLLKGAEEPYISRPILEKARAMNIPLVPGDDSHSIDTVGLNIERGIRLLQSYGFTTQWQRPVSGKK